MLQSRSQPDMDDVLWNFKLPLQLNCHHTVMGHEKIGRKPAEPFFDVPGLCPSLKQDGLGCTLGALTVLDPLADCLSDGC